ncbi:DMT family transporter [Gallibacterium genomosp. 3]|uniref:EamA domain-containing protein n=1 Tax=Gallibacterium genomosp. 3 TaxID=505345 RepID=A0A1A7PWQ7_9PAST|nr:DMT family transporter [Gallibacterium genomosp. 3]OBX06157.1 hypothetical protein QV07_09065 [Gallibacterium genomosp. 3]
MKQQPIIGFILVLIAILMWGTLPIILQPVLPYIDNQTVVWCRFFVAAVGAYLILFMGKKQALRPLLKRQHLIFLLLGIIGLCANFLLYNLTLKYIPATVSQVLSPLSSFFMLICGIFIFKEKLLRHQKIGLFILLVGLGLFFNDRFADFSYVNNFSLGIFFCVMSSVVWVVYAVAQKFLLRYFSSQQILFVMYLGCTLVFLPTADPSQLATLSPITLLFLFYGCVGTILAYGCYAEALNRWDVSKISMIMPLIPIVTMLFSYLFALIAPSYFSYPSLNIVSYLGAGVVVFGAFFSSAGHKFIGK